MGFRLPYFPLYAAETLADGRFQGWTLEERGAWITLLCCNWNDGDLPAAQTTLARLLGVGPGDMARIWSAIGDRFSEAPGAPGRVVSPRLEGERDKALSLGRIRAEAGEKGAKARWNTGKKPHGKRMRLPEQTHGKANAVAMRSVCPSPSTSESPSPPTTAAPPLERLPSKPELHASRFPVTQSLIDLLSESGSYLAHPKARGEELEAALVVLGVEDVARGLSRELEGRPDIGSLGFFQSKLIAAAKRPALKANGSDFDPRDESWLPPGSDANLWRTIRSNIFADYPEDAAKRLVEARRQFIERFAT